MDVWLVSHARTRAELTALFNSDPRILYVEDTGLQRTLWRLGRRLPTQLAHFTLGFVSRLATQIAQRRVIKSLVAEHDIEVIHQPMPVSPREPSLLFGFGRPVIIGPMNGGMDYPLAFRASQGFMGQMLLQLGRASSDLMNLLLPGKRRAALLLVANQRTRDALPRTAAARVLSMVENGVDLSLWHATSAAIDPQVETVTTFVFMGRLIPLKCVDVLLHAFKSVASQAPMRLLVIGDGVERKRLEHLAGDLGLLDEQVDEAPVRRCVYFLGWLSQSDCAKT